MTATLVRITKLSISLVYFLFIWVLELISVLFGYKRKAKIVVLYYHGVAESEQEEFKWQMNDLLQWATPINVNTEFSFEPNKRYALVTFDDGFRNVKENALPVLVENNIPALIFVVAGYLGLPASWTINNTSLYKVYTVMTESDIKGLPSELICIGSHSRSHNRLNKLAYQNALEELIESKYILEKILDDKVRYFSFPYGAYNDALIQMAFDSGYEKVFTSNPKLQFNFNQEKVIGRFPVSPQNWKLEFRLKVLGAYHWLGQYFYIRSKIVSFLSFNTKKP